MTVHFRREPQENDGRDDLLEDVVEHHALEDIGPECADAKKELHVGVALRLTRVDHIKEVAPCLLLRRSKHVVRDIGGSVTELVDDDSLGKLIEMVHSRPYIVYRPIPCSIRVSERILGRVAEWLVRISIRVDSSARRVNRWKARRTGGKGNPLTICLRDAGDGEVVVSGVLRLSGWGTSLEWSIRGVTTRVQRSSAGSMAGVLGRVASRGGHLSLVILLSGGPSRGQWVGREQGPLLVHEGASVRDDVIVIVVGVLAASSGLRRRRRTLRG